MKKIKSVKKYEAGGASDTMCPPGGKCGKTRTLRGKTQRFKTGPSPGRTWMSNMAEGGSTTDECFDGGGRKRGKGCKSVTKYGRRSIPEPVKKIAGAAAAGVGAVLANKKFGLVEKAKEAMGLKKGGSVKRKMQSGGTANSTLADSERRIASSARAAATAKPTPSSMQKGGTSSSRKMTVNMNPVKKSKYTTPTRKTPMAQNGGAFAAKIKPVVKAVKAVKATVKRRG